MKPNKKLFFDVVTETAKLCHLQGFVEHPSYASIWEAENQAYTATLIRLSGSNFIDQLTISFYPSWFSFRFDVKRSTNSFSIKTLDDVPNDAAQWTECWLYEPFDEYLLKSGRAWNVFSIKNDFSVKKRMKLDVKIAARTICKEFTRNSTFLFDALDGNYQGRMVAVRRHTIERLLDTQ